MCDVESYIYLPLIEEMSYMPKHKYASGSEIRQYCDMLAAKYGLHDRAMFQCAGKSMTWDEKNHEWIVEVTKKPKGGQQSLHTFRADFTMIAPGVLSNAHIPDLDGLESFKGHMFHTARWDYEYTEGSPEDPTLTGLRGKKVAFIGTGPTAVQAVPHLAKYADQLTIWQRTPSAVDVRGNHETDPARFSSEVASKKGWYRERNLNFIGHLEGGTSKPERNMVDDEWTRMESYMALVGGPKQVTMENVEQHVGELYANDYQRQERLRERTKAIVKDQHTAGSLQAWYPGWCKRPCFHDEYLQAFNSPNVKLLDTEGKGFDRLTEKGIEFAGTEYDFGK
jgi:cation diffusion facilitator CzcD-associated flavoprotein CzcO